MAVAKRPGREKPAKIEQRKVLGPEREPQVKQTTHLPKPNLHRTGPGTEKLIKRGAKTLSLSRVMGRSSLHVFVSMCPHASKMDFPAII